MTNSAASDPISVARRYVQTEHPDAVAAVLGGSVSRGQGTATSDLDIAIVYDTGNVNYAETVRFEGWLVETFVHDRESLDGWYDSDAAGRRAIMSDVWGQGIPLLDNAVTEAIQQDARARFAAGPPPLSAAELDSLRYALSASLDDLRGAPSGAGAYFVTAELLESAADLLLLLRGSWLGRGKWVARRLAALGPDDAFAVELLDIAAHDKKQARLLDAAAAVLDLAGGYLQAGHLRGSKPGPVAAR